MNAVGDWMQLLESLDEDEHTLHLRGTVIIVGQRAGDSSILFSPVLHLYLYSCPLLFDFAVSAKSGGVHFLTL